MRERRKQPRLDVRLRAVVRDNRSKSWNARTLDISQGGALLDSSRSLASGAEIELLFDLDTVEVAPIKAKVLRCHSAFWGRRHTVAVQFEDDFPAIMQIAEQTASKRRVLKPAFAQPPKLELAL
ncbi:MAG: PilZ domain-containing protein [Candidatus Eremiobacteraeota bacterium]|nr:PilZ domain-containing protein [Candidatus Eremiobacteraeota bacterium]